MAHIWELSARMVAPNDHVLDICRRDAATQRNLSDGAVVIKTRHSAKVGSRNLAISIFGANLNFH